MNHLRQLTIILAVYALGVFISSKLPFPIPGSVIGMLLLFVSLTIGLIRLDQVESISNFMLDNLAFFFLPAGVGLLAYSKLLITVGPVLMAICAVTTWAVMVFTGRLVQWLINKEA